MVRGCTLASHLGRSDVKCRTSSGKASSELMSCSHTNVKSTSICFRPNQCPCIAPVILSVSEKLQLSSDIICDQVAVMVMIDSKCISILTNQQPQCLSGEEFEIQLLNKFFLSLK